MTGIMRHNSSIILKIAVCLGMLCIVWMASAESEKPKLSDGQLQAEQAALVQIRTVLDDTVVPERVHKAQLKYIPDAEADDLSQQTSKMRVINYAILSSDKRVVGSCALYVKSNRSFSYLISYPNEDLIKPATETLYDTMIPRWDAFVDKYWPGLKREKSWRQAIAQYSAGEATFPLRYMLSEEGINLEVITLDIRLSDAKIGGITFHDWRTDIRESLNGQPIPTAPSKEKIVSTVLIALSKGQYWPNYWRHSKKINNLHILDSRRSYTRLHYPGEEFGFVDSMQVRASTADNIEISFAARYIEKTSQAEIGQIEEMKKLENEHDMGGDELEKLLTIVIDNQPLWSADGKQFYFLTSRDVADRPWWQRGSEVISIAYCQGQSKASLVKLIRPIKPSGNDFGSYIAGDALSTANCLAVILPDSDGQFCALDMQQGVLYLPVENLQQNDALRRWNIPKDALPEGTDWKIASARWLTISKALLLSLHYDFADYDLYLAQQVGDKPLQKWNLFPIATERGDDIFVRLAHQDRLLAWAHQVYKRERDKKPDEKDQWQFILADFDAATAKATNRRTLDLPGEPTSISYDSKDECWLVVLEDGEMLWIKEENGKLVSSKAGTIKWGEIGLKPTSADVSPDGSKIAVAAELDKPQVYEKTECVVHSLIFLWDGKSEQVTPAYDPSLNGIPRYNFPNGSPWAKIVGDVKKFGLEGIADPAYFVTPLAPAKPLQ